MQFKFIDRNRLNIRVGKKHTMVTTSQKEAGVAISMSDKDFRANNLKDEVIS